MLVLSRREDQTVVIGDNIVLTVLRIQGNTVRIGIQAPRDVRIVRGELIERASAVEVDDPGQPLWEAA